jgi:hypothetical protein
MINKELITIYGEQQIHILWTVIAVLIIVVFFLVFGKKKIVSVPVLFNVKLLSERMNMLIYGLSVGPAVDGDVVKRVLTVEVNSELVETREFEPSATDLGEIGVVEGDNVNLALVDVDDAGNTSEPAFVRFVAVDTIPPVTPGSFGATLLREVAPSVDVEESDVTPVVEVVMPDPVDMDNVSVVDQVVPKPPESAPSGHPDDPGPLTDPVPESPPSGDPVR